MARRSDLAFVLPKLRIAGADYLLLHWHAKWGDWSLLGGHVEAGEEEDWSRAAVREANEELAPLRSGADFTVERQALSQLEWGPVPSRSHDNTPTISGILSAPLAAGESVQVLRDGAVINARVTVDGEAWRVTDGRVADGNHTYTARVVDAPPCSQSGVTGGYGR